MDNRDQTYLSKLQLRQQFEIRKMELSVEFAKYGFYGTLVGALTGMIVVLALAFVVAWGKIAQAALIVVVFAIVLALAVIAFGFFSLFRSPAIGIEWKDLKTSIGQSESGH